MINGENWPNRAKNDNFIYKLHGVLAVLPFEYIWPSLIKIETEIETKTRTLFFPFPFPIPFSLVRPIVK